MADVDQLVLGSVNASWRRQVDAETLVSAFRNPRVADAWPAHLSTFFEEVSREAMSRFLDLHDVDVRDVLETYHRIVPEESDRDGELEAWFGELADAA